VFRSFESKSRARVLYYCMTIAQSQRPPLCMPPILASIRCSKIDVVQHVYFFEQRNYNIGDGNIL